MSIGIPSTTLGAGGREGSTLALRMVDAGRSYEGPQLCLLTALTLIGIDGGAAPLLPVYTASPAAEWQDSL